MNSIYNRQVLHPKLGARKPTLTERDIVELKKDPTLRCKIELCSSKDQVVIAVMNHLLQLNLALNEDLITLGKNIKNHPNQQVGRR